MKKIIECLYVMLIIIVPCVAIFWADGGTLNDKINMWLFVPVYIGLGIGVIPFLNEKAGEK